MDQMQAYSLFLFDYFLNDEERKLVHELEIEIELNNEKYSLDSLWCYDSFIGGIGAYSMPADPKLNPFAGGYVRYLFRPLQYVRCSMEILDINYTSRDVIRDCGLYLEFMMKFLLKQNAKIRSLIHHNGTLGVISNDLYRIKVIDDDCYDFLVPMIKLYNRSKHTINTDEYREMSFTPIDAIVYYLCSRKLTDKLLRPYYNQIYTDFGNRLKYFYINYNYERDFGYVK